MCNCACLRPLIKLSLQFKIEVCTQQTCILGGNYYCTSKEIVMSQNHVCTCLKRVEFPCRQRTCLHVQSETENHLSAGVLYFCDPSVDVMLVLLLQEHQHPLSHHTRPFGDIQGNDDERKQRSETGEPVHAGAGARRALQNNPGGRNQRPAVKLPSPARNIFTE